MSCIDRAVEASVRRIVGPTILMSSGRYYDFENPEACGLTDEDIAYGLAYTCRFSGQCMIQGTLGQRLRATMPRYYAREMARTVTRNRHVFYSVAEHCVRFSRIVPPNRHLEVGAMAHEFGEAPMTDVSGPLKSILPGWKVIEHRCCDAEISRRKIQMPDSLDLKHWDLVMLATERRDLMPWIQGEDWQWLGDIQPHPDRIIPWSPDHAASAYLERMRELYLREDDHSYCP